MFLKTHINHLKYTVLSAPDADTLWFPPISCHIIVRTKNEQVVKPNNLYLQIYTYLKKQQQQHNYFLYTLTTQFNISHCLSVSMN